MVSRFFFFNHAFLSFCQLCALLHKYKKWKSLKQQPFLLRILESTQHVGQSHHPPRAAKRYAEHVYVRLLDIGLKRSLVLTFPAPTAGSEVKDVAKDVGTEYLKSVAEEGGKETVQYGKENGQQQLDEAKAEVQVCFACNSSRLWNLMEFSLNIGLVDEILWLFIWLTTTRDRCIQLLWIPPYIRSTFYRHEKVIQVGNLACDRHFPPYQQSP